MRRRTILAQLAAGVALLGCSTSPPAPPKPVAKPAPLPKKADRVLVLKGARKLMLMAGDRTIKTYTVSLGRTPVGHKQRQGDGKTPEGVYTLDYRNPNSQYYRSIHISYPRPQDLAHARKLGVSAGGDIMIHGLPNGKGWIGKDHARFDWTEGCIAVTNEEMDEIWAMVDDGTRIEIRP